MNQIIVNAKSRGNAKAGDVYVNGDKSRAIIIACLGRGEYRGISLIDGNRYSDTHKGLNEIDSYLREEGYFPVGGNLKITIED